jgi:hypothetical protein
MADPQTVDDTVTKVADVKGKFITLEEFEEMGFEKVRSFGHGYHFNRPVVGGLHGGGSESVFADYLKEKDTTTFVLDKNQANFVYITNGPFYYPPE